MHHKSCKLLLCVILFLSLSPIAYNDYNMDLPWNVNGNMIQKYIPVFYKCNRVVCQKSQIVTIF